MKTKAYCVENSVDLIKIGINHKCQSLNVGNSGKHDDFFRNFLTVLEDKSIEITLSLRNCKRLVVVITDPNES